MKKVLSAVLAAVLLVGAVFAFSSCSLVRPEMDLEKAKENLEKEGFTVSYYGEDDEALDVEEAEYLRAYKAAESEDEDSLSLTIIVFKNASVAKAFYESYKTENKAELDMAKSELKVLKATLKACEDDMTPEEIEEMEEDIAELEEDIAEYQKEYVLGRSGKTVWYGNKAAVDATKG